AVLGQCMPDGQRSGEPGHVFGRVIAGDAAPAVRRPFGRGKGRWNVGRGTVQHERYSLGWEREKCPDPERSGPVVTSGDWFGKLWGLRRPCSARFRFGSATGPTIRRVQRG